MAIVIKAAGGIVNTNPPSVRTVEIIADSEGDITALGSVVADKYGVNVVPYPGSMAYTADMSVVYQLSPSGTWTKVV